MALIGAFHDGVRVCFIRLSQASELAKAGAENVFDTVASALFFGPVGEIEIEHVEIDARPKGILKITKAALGGI